MILAETAIELLTDRSHWIFEAVSSITIDVIVLGLVWTPIKRWWDRHHRNEH